MGIHAVWFAVHDVQAQLGTLHAAGLESAEAREAKFIAFRGTRITPRRKTSAVNPRAQIFLRAAAARFVAQRFALPLLTGRFSRYPYKKNVCMKLVREILISENLTT